MKGIVLASGSPRRRELLGLLGLPFEVVVSRVKEDAAKDEDVRKTAMRLARMKAEAAAHVRQGEVIVASDTLVVLGDRVMGKPENAAEALAMLQALRGRKHQVTSGIVVHDPSGRSPAVHAVETQVWMRDYSDGEIADYMARDEPFDKAGGYAIQDRDFRPVDRIEGCYSNVMGLPLCHLYVLLEQVGVTPPVSPHRACEMHTEQRCLVAVDILDGANR